MTEELKSHRGTSQFIDRRVVDPEDPEGRRRIDSEIARRRPDRHSRVVYDATTPSQTPRVPSEAEVLASYLVDSPKKRARIMGKVISAARNSRRP